MKPTQRLVKSSHRILTELFFWFFVRMVYRGENVGVPQLCGLGHFSSPHCSAGGVFFRQVGTVEKPLLPKTPSEN